MLAAEDPDPASTDDEVSRCLALEEKVLLPSQAPHSQTETLRRQVAFRPSITLPPQDHLPSSPRHRLDRSTFIRWGHKVQSHPPLEPTLLRILRNTNMSVPAL